MTGWSTQEKVGEPFASLLHPVDRALHEEQVARVLDGETPDPYEVRLLTRPGTELTVELRCAPKIQDGKPIGQLGIARDVTWRKRILASLEFHALHDALTSLPNRTLFQDRLSQALRTAQRQHEATALLLVDLDRFKTVNDTLGHQAGDEVLRQLAHRLESGLRSSDTVARLGGDEFGVVLPPPIDRSAVRQAANRLLGAAREPFEIKDRTASIGASIGVAIFPDHGLESETLLGRADAAMYEAKRSGMGYAEASA
jgi:diguanylate cyclase (GGDEF)-like protein/PAS domain S-box-containing protein